MSNPTPDEIFGQVIVKTKYLPTKTVTKSSAKVDESVKTIEDRVRNWQEILNNWRIAIIQNEQAIIILCIIFGIVYSYAINECTGNLNFPIYVYVLTGIIVALFSLLLITEGSLPLLVLVKFAVSIALGHYAMMWVIAVDGHTWEFFVVYVCRYPMTWESIAVYIVGGGCGYISAKFEEIKAGENI